MRTRRLGAIDAIVVPNLEIIFHHIARLSHIAREVDRVEKLLFRFTGKSNFLYNGLLDCCVGHIGTQHLEFELGEAIVILDLSAEKHPLWHCRVGHLHDGNHGESVVNNRDGIVERIGVGNTSQGPLRTGKKSILRRLHSRDGMLHPTVGLGQQCHKMVVQTKMQRIGITCLEHPGNPCTFWHHQITLVGNDFSIAFSISRVGEGGLKMDNRRSWKDLQRIHLGLHTSSCELYLVRMLQVLEEVSIMALIHLVHPVASVVDHNENLIGYGSSLNGKSHLVIVLLRCHQIVVLEQECERSRFLVIGGMVDETFGRLRDKRGCHQQYYNNEQQREKSILDVLAILGKIDGIKEWNRRQLLAFLVDTGRQQLVVDIGIHHLQLEQVQQFVFDLGEMAPYNDSSIVVADTFTHMPHLQ